MSSNVHTLKDVQYSPARVPITQSSSVVNESSRGRSCLDFFFPGFRLKSFILAISIVQIIVFIVSLGLGSTRLAPGYRTLYNLGASYGPAIQNGQVHRLILPILLHASIWHILLNVFFQMRMGFGMEKTYGVSTIAGVYLLCGLCGNIMSVSIAPCHLAVGASTAGFGLIGVQMANLALTWRTIQAKDQAIFNIVLFVAISLIITLSPHSRIDWRGHLGGFIAGFSLGVLLGAHTLPRWYKTGRIVAVLALIGLIVAGLACIFAIPMSSRGCWA